MLAMLAEAIDNDPSPFDRAIAASFMALGEIERGQFQSAEEWLRKARDFDPDCVPLRRIEAHLQGLRKRP